MRGREIWGPATPILIAWEMNERREKERWLRSLSVHLYSRRSLLVPYEIPQYVLRRRAMYGGRKGRAAIKRLRALGARPLNYADLAEQ